MVKLNKFTVMRNIAQSVGYLVVCSHPLQESSFINTAAKIGSLNVCSQ